MTARYLRKTSKDYADPIEVPTDVAAPWDAYWARLGEWLEESGHVPEGDRVISATVVVDADGEQVSITRLKYGELVEDVEEE